jgi:hypothetical protein
MPAQIRLRVCESRAGHVRTPRAPGGVGEDRGPGVRGMMGAHERRMQGRDAVPPGFHAFSLLGDGEVSNA